MNYMKFLKVPRSEAEAVRKELVSNNLFDANYQIISESDFVLFPVKGKYKKFEIIEREGTKRTKIPSSIKEILKGKLSEKEFEQLVGSFDILGNIAIVEVPESLSKYESEIGNAVMLTHKHVLSVYKKLGGMSGEFRVRKLALIAGVPNHIASYLENGARMEFDVTKVYFSVRLAHERDRISKLMKDNEHVLVFFAGVGPFALVMAKKHKKAKIVAIELNPDAFISLKSNISLNRFSNVIPEMGDVRDIVLKKYQNFADRIVMPLPHSAHEFLTIAFAGIKTGGIIHFYTIVEQEGAFEKALALAEKEAKKSNVKIEVVDRKSTRLNSSHRL